MKGRPLTATEVGGLLTALLLLLFCCGGLVLVSAFSDPVAPPAEKHRPPVVSSPGAIR